MDEYAPPRLTRLIEGTVEDPRDAQLADASAANRQLRGELIHTQAELAQARADLDHATRAGQGALRNLRRQLTPLYRALQAVFGELDSAGIEDGGVDGGGAGPARVDSRVAAVWESWKGRLGPQCGKVIDSLLLHGDMNTQQLAIAVGTRRQNIPGLIYKLNQAGLIRKNGGRFSLKSLT